MFHRSFESGNWILPLLAQPLHLRQSVKVGIPVTDTVFEADSSLSDDPSFMAAIAEGQIIDVNRNFT